MRACVYLCVTDLPVQVEAATSIKYLLDVTDPAMDAMLLPILPDMLNQYFAIMAEISNDMVIQVSATVLTLLSITVVLADVLHQACR
jgi:hypothetical protein